MNWLATENSITWLPGFPANALPSVSFKAIRPVFKGQEVGLEIGGVVGSLGLTNGDTLHISPKIGDINFLRMLFVCEGLREQLQPELTRLTASYQQSNETNLPSLIALNFLWELVKLKSTSLRFARQRVEEQDSFVRGRLAIVPSLLNIKQGKSKAAVFDTLKRNYDIAENRVLAAAAIQAIQLVPVNGTNHAVEAAKFWINNFYNPKTLIQDITAINRRLHKGQTGGARGYYNKALSLAKILLGQSGLIAGSLPEISGDSVLINTANLFEEYIRSTIADSYSKRGLIVRKGAQPAQSLYTDGSFRLLPDICVYQQDNLILIADVKYKIPDAKDQYQLQVYMDAYKSKIGAFFTPSYDDAPFLITQKNSILGSKIFEVRLSLKDLNLTEDFLGRILQELGVLGGK